MSDHTKVYGICENLCKVEVSPKTKVDELDGRVDELEERSQNKIYIKKYTIPTVSDIPAHGFKESYEYVPMPQNAQILSVNVLRLFEGGETYVGTYRYNDEVSEDEGQYYLVVELYWVNPTNYSDYGGGEIRVLYSLS